MPLKEKIKKPGGLFYHNHRRSAFNPPETYTVYGKCRILQSHSPERTCKEPAAEGGLKHQNLHDTWKFQEDYYI
jgi:hypothetical protein